MSYLQKKRGSNLTLLLPKQQKPKALLCKNFLFAIAVALFGIMPMMGYGQSRATRDCEPITVTANNLFEEFFETSPSTPLPDCWGFLNAYDDCPAVLIDYSCECYCLRLQVFNNGEEECLDQYAILPAMYDISGLQMTFFANGYLYNDWGGDDMPAPFIVGVMTDPEDPETFQPVRNLTCNSDKISYTVYFNQYEDDGMYIAIKLVAPDEYETNLVCIDDIVVSVMPSCLIPSNLSVANNSITENSATVSWTSNSDESAWEIRYSTDQADWTSVPVTENPYTLGDLTGNTLYYIQLRADCGDNDYSEWSNMVSFQTSCPVFQSIPYSENFDSYQPYDPYGEEKSGYYLPSCWNSINEIDDWEYSDYSEYPAIYNDYDVESNCLKFYVLNGNGGSNFDQYAILPAFENISDLQMNFKAVAGESDDHAPYAPFSIGVMTDPTDAESFEEVLFCEVWDEWEKMNAYFDNYTGQGQYIAIKVGASPEVDDSYILYIDDVVVSTLPTCFVPYHFKVIDIYENEIAMSWNPYGQETSWQVCYSTDQNNWTMVDYMEQNTGDTIIEQLTGLVPNTLYYIQMRANCGNDDYSGWSTTRSFRTGCSEFQSVPYYEDFQTYKYPEMPQCWDKINTATDYSNKMYPLVSGYYDHYSGSTGTSLQFLFYTYNYGNPKDQTAIMPRMENISSLKLSFDGKRTSVRDNYISNFRPVKVGVIDDNDEFHLITTIDLNVEGFLNYTVTFEDYDGAGDIGRIAFLAEYFSSGWTQYYVWIDNIAVEPVMQETITPYTSDNDGWNLIASPVLGSIQPTNVMNMVSETEENYDLFAFDQSANGVEWRNYKADGFALQNGQGYLYANSNPVTLGFAGTMQPAMSIDVPLDYTAGNTYAGWNLIGNPFNVNATLTGVSDFYRINGNTLEVASGEIEPCEGIFVQATTNGQSVTFARTDVAQGEPETKGVLDFGLYGGSVRHRLDLVRIRFGEGNNLGKLNLLSDPNKLSIPIDGKDYAVVHTGTIGELPLNFRAAEKESFTLSINVEEVDMSYLHLIDNLTGKDIDLLSTPSYSFDANPTDYASRFKVVFDQGSSAEQESFGFIRNGHLHVLGEGQYTLQIIDMMGRVLSSEVVSGNYDKPFNVAPGIYMLRLVNGNDVKVQKIMNK